MRLARFRRGNEDGLAASAGGAFHGIAASHPDYPGEPGALLRAGVDLVEIGRTLVASAPAIDLDAVTLLPPVAAPSKIICVGLNYRSHSAEAGMATPASPTIFARFASSLIGARTPIRRPRQSPQLDYEAELVAVIGRGGRDIALGAALDHVAGYSIFNDVSVRDFQFKTPQWTIGKNFDASGPFGPVLVTPDELPPGAAGLRIQARVNGTVLQDANTRDMVFDVASLISLLSETMTLEAGDVLVTGTPGGVGMARTPPLWLKPGDVCEIEIERIGILRNPVVAE